MNLLDLAVKITCDDQASGKVEGIGSKITGALGTAAKAGIAAIGGLVAATAGIGGVALNAYADYEQLVGGVETLFGAGGKSLEEYAASVGQSVDAARGKYDQLIAAQNQVMTNADQAFKTAGMSANDYMETATSFSASLIQGLNGDTQAAAAATNMAITDMSDNANKMGTDIGMIRDAYQGFAKDNYDMLDNLKLGYGGTQAEMARLINDTGVMGDAFKATAKNVNEVPFDKMIEAIHQVQTEMGITGTTSKEAATTIEGSVNTMKAAWENWLTGLGDEDADMGALTDQLVSSLDTVVKNVAPRIGVIIGTLGMELVNHGPELAQQIGDMLINAFTEAFNLVAGIIGENTELPTFEISTDDVYNALDQLAQIFQTVKDNADWLVPSLAAVAGGITAFQAASTVVGIIQGLQAAFTAWRTATEGMTIAQIALNAVMNANPFVLIATVIGTLVAAFVTLMATNESFRNAVINAWNQIVATAQAVWGAVVNFFTVTVPQAIQSLITWFSQLPGNIAAFLSMIIANVGSWAASMASNAISAASNFVNNVVNFLASLPGRVLGFLNSVITNVLNFVSQMGQQAANAATQFANSLINGLASIPGRVVSIGSDIIGGLVNGVVGAAGRLIGAVKDAVGNAIDTAKNFLGIASPSKVFREIGRYSMQGAALGVDDDAQLLQESTEDAMRGMVSSARGYETSPTQANGTTAAGLMLDELRALRQDIKSLRIYLDGRTLVGGIADEMDKQLGRRAAWLATR